MTRLLVLGASGMFGSAAFRILAADSRYDVWGTLRDSERRRFFPAPLQERLISGVDVLEQDTLTGVMLRVRPDIVINCVGLVKQHASASDPLAALPINAMLPHRLARLCDLSRCRLVHLSTDCVFSGRKGMYTEADHSDAEDLYGKSKFIGEIASDRRVVTLRTSIVGHEQRSTHGLIDWFLASSGRVKGFAKAIFSGLTTVELARVMRDYVIPRDDLWGLYHLAVAPISKLELLRLVAAAYGHDVEIQPSDDVVVDRSLDGRRFTQATGYAPPTWPQLIADLHCDYLSSGRIS